MTGKMTVALSVLLSCCWVAGCMSPQQQAVQAFQEELESRRVSLAKSMELYQRGTEACQAGETGKSEALFREAVQVDDRNVYAWMQLGRLAFEDDRLFDAAVSFERVTRYEPERFEPHYNIGMVLERAGRFDEAAKAYEVALSLAPDHLHVMENLIRCYVRGDRESERVRQLAERCLAREGRPEWRDWLQAQASRPISRNTQGE